MMGFILGLIVSLAVGFLLSVVGHFITKTLKVTSGSKLLDFLVDLALGISLFLILLNLIGNLTKSFYLGLTTSFIVIIALVIWQNKEAINKLKCLVDIHVLKSIFSACDRYFWTLLIVTNLIYGITAFSSTKIDHFGLGNKHIFNINNLLSGNYPPRYSSLPDIPEKFHYGSDILGATLSKFSTVHPELALDLLTIIFINLTFLAVYAIASRLVSNEKITKYVTIFAAFLAWGPIITLFKKIPNEVLPPNVFNKIAYLAQTRLTFAAEWTGLNLHWFFSPPAGFSLFFLLIAIYLVFKFLHETRNIKFVVLIAFFLSSFAILDFFKFALLVTGLVLFILFAYPIQEIDEIKPENKEFWTNLPKYFAILIASSIILAFIHGNWLLVGTNYESLIKFFNIGNSSIPKGLSPLNTNIILLGVFVFGFYLAYKQGQKWIISLIPYFVSSLAIPHLITLPGTNVGQFFMTTNFLGAFTLPFAFNFIKEKLQLKDTASNTVFLTVFLLIFSANTLMYFMFGGIEKPTFQLAENKIKYNGLQKLYPEERKKEINVISKGSKGSTFLADPQDEEFIAINTGLFHLTSLKDLNKEHPLKANLIDAENIKLFEAYSLESKQSENLKIKWLYMTPKLFNFMLPTEARIRLLNAYLSNGIKLVLSNNATEPANLKEVYKLEPKTLSQIPTADNLKALEKLFQPNKKEKVPEFIKQIALCPYRGIYNAKSNDFDGDKIADIAFYDPVNKKVYIINSKDNQESTVDLSSFISITDDIVNTFIPIPSDYDGDSKSDIAFFNNTTRLWHIKVSSGLFPRNHVKWGWVIGEKPIPGDTDGDSKCDLIAFTPTNNPTNYARWPTLLSTNNYNYSDSIFPTSTVEDVPLEGDIDGDKKSDHLIYRPSASLFSAFISTRNYNINLKAEAMIGNKYAIAVPADYDGDRKVDLATWSPDLGTWEIVFSKDLIGASPQGETPSQSGCGFNKDPGAKEENCPVKSFTLGKAGDIPMPADYNGDGKDEIAILNKETWNLEIMQTGSNIKKVDLSKYKDLIPASFIGI